MATMYTVMLLISHHVQQLSDTLYLLSIFTISGMLSLRKEDVEIVNPYSETKLTTKCVLELVWESIHR